MNRLSNFRLLELIAVGSFSEVWSCRLLKGDEMIGPGMAVKISHSLATSFDARQALFGVKSVLSTSHRNILKVHMIDDSFDGRLAVATELAEYNLWQITRSKPAQSDIRQTERLLKFLREAAAGLDHLSSSGFSHCTITPFDVLVVGGEAKIGDFDYVHETGRVLKHREHLGVSNLCCMAPEVRAGRAHRNSDQYSLGASYCWLRLGELPKKGIDDSVIDLGRLSNAERRVLGIACSADPECRFRSCSEFVRELGNCIEGNVSL